MQSITSFNAVYNLINTLKIYLKAKTFLGQEKQL